MAISWGRKTSERSGLGISNSPFLQILPAPPQITSAWHSRFTSAWHFRNERSKKKRRNTKTKGLKGLVPLGLAESSSLSLRTGYTPKVALHLSSRKRSYHRIQGGNVTLTGTFTLLFKRLRRRTSWHIPCAVHLESLQILKSGRHDGACLVLSMVFARPLTL